MMVSLQLKFNFLALRQICAFAQYHIKCILHQLAKIFVWVKEYHISYCFMRIQIVDWYNIFFNPSSSSMRNINDRVKLPGNDKKKNNDNDGNSWKAQHFRLKLCLDCEYHCKPGRCSVRYRYGSSRGSCSRRRCRNTPSECENCITYCRNCIW